MKIKQALPWQAKIVAKIALSRLPFDYRFWQRLDLFKHGGMEQPEYAHKVFRSHFERADFSGKSGGFTVLELGPGDTLFSAVIARAYGAGHCYLVDIGHYARSDVLPYQAMANWLNHIGLVAPAIAGATNLTEVLSICRAQYLNKGLHSLKEIPDSSVDFIWSEAVLEHIRANDFHELMHQLRRILRPGGICSHEVDLKDHLGGALNNLRFSSRIWESNFLARSGFYTNRIRYGEMLRGFVQAGFDVDVLRTERFATLPTPRESLAPEYRSLPEDDLLVSSFDVVLRPST